ncbi:MAG: molybdate ABC transporter substrate-binding protein [Acidimicrobiia bacterium]|nr:molybdate ABC transporter substrate-binding protein [Acidimicrobiia bacterium]
MGSILRGPAAFDSARATEAGPHRRDVGGRVRHATANPTPGAGRPVGVGLRALSTVEGSRPWVRVVALFAVLVCVPTVVHGQAGEVVVSAASSLTDVMQQVADAWEARTAQRVALNTGPSNTLARQIAAGAPVDVFLSADEAQMDRVASAIAPGSRVDLLRNQLAIVAPVDRPFTLGSARDLATAPIRRLALGDPAAVPAGVYARRYLEGLGIWRAIEPRVVPMGSVRLALAAVEQGAVDAGIVYVTDIRRAERVRTVLVVPADRGPRIVYPAAALRGGPNPDAARRFLTFLQSPEAAAIFIDEGFLLPRP